MNPLIQSYLAVASALGCGLMAGTFFAFSVFVLPALAKLPSAQGIAAMQSINVVVLNPIFLGVFALTAFLCVALAGSVLFIGFSPAAAWWICGALSYFFGNVVVTGFCNIPLNDALAATNATSPEATPAWKHFVASWSRWNHVRTLTGIAATTAIIVGLAAH